MTRRRSYRKSTSDLTEADSETFVMKPQQQQQQPQPRRRGSSKGGLAYLASRRERGSRDSIRSNASNASIFSNEDIGPLAFQASERGRQRRTSNFLELPGTYVNYEQGRVCLVFPALHSLHPFTQVNIDLRRCHQNPQPASRQYSSDGWQENLQGIMDEKMGSNPQILLEHGILLLALDGWRRVEKEGRVLK